MVSYGKPPIIEAIFEARFTTGSWASVQTSYEIFSALKTDYPGEPRLLHSNGFEIVQGDDKDPTPSIRLKSEDSRYRLTAVDGTCLVQYNKQMLSVHVTAPYGGWPDFRHRITKALSVYIEKAQPQAISRMSLRYINQIEFQLSSSINLNDYFTNPPDIPDQVGVSIGAFFMRLETHMPDRPIRIVQSFASTSGGLPGVLLDLDVIKEQDIAKPRVNQQLLKDIDHLRDVERLTFEALITDKLRETFDAD